MAKNRIKELLALCAKDLENGCSPLHHDFLVKHDVTSDECYTLSQQMSALINYGLMLDAGEFAEAVVVGAMHGMGETEMAKAMQNSLRLKRAAEKLNKYNA